MLIYSNHFRPNGVAAPSEIFDHAQPVPVASSSALELCGAKDAKLNADMNAKGKGLTLNSSDPTPLAKAPTIAYISQLFCATGTNHIKSHGY